MKKLSKYLKISIVIVAMAAWTNAYSQDFRYTQSYANPLTLNPAIMGANPNLNIILNYRSQWSGIDNGFKTYSFTALYPIFMKSGKEKLDIGANANNDKAGAFSTLNYSLAIGYSLPVSDAGHLSFSLIGSYVQKSLDTKNLTFNEQYVLGSYSASNPNNEVILNQKVSYPDVGFGMMWYYNPAKADGAKINAYAGISGFHLNKPNETLLSGIGALPRKFSTQGGIKIIGKGKVDFTPNIIGTYQNGLSDIATGLYVDYHVNEKAKLVLGTWYRSNGAFAFSLGFSHKSFTLGYSYDLASTDLNNAIPGMNANEITLSYKLDQASKKNIKMNASPFNTF